MFFSLGKSCEYHRCGVREPRARACVRALKKRNLPLARPGYIVMRRVSRYLPLQNNPPVTAVYNDSNPEDGSRA
jgi:hypothetical protein